MQLRQAEAVGVLYDHHRRIGHVHADFDNGSRHQNLRLPSSETLHNRLLFRTRHASAQKLHLPIGENRTLKEFRFLLGGCNVVAGIVLVALDADGGIHILVFVAFAARRLAGARVALLRALPNQGTHHIHLLAALKGLARRIIRAPAFLLRKNRRGSARRRRRTLAQIRQLGVAKQRQSQRTRNGRGG